MFFNSDASTPLGWHWLRHVLWLLKIKLFYFCNLMQVENSCHFASTASDASVGRSAVEASGLTAFFYAALA